MSDFKTTDFVQVEHWEKLHSGEPITAWRNALYVGQKDGDHVVIYTDGTKQVLNKNVPIRKLTND